MAEANKTEQATPRRQQKARESGQVARSRELSNTLAGIGAVSLFFWRCSGAVPRWQHLFGATLDAGAQRTFSPVPLMFWAGREILWAVGPAMLAAFALALLSSLLQGGLVFAPEAMKLDPGKFSPVKKLKQMFSMAGMGGLLKSLLPFSAIIYLSYFALERRWTDVLQASSIGLRAFVSLVTSIGFEIAWKSALVLVIWAGVDYLLVWRKLRGDLMMSKQDLREESKESEGNPAVRGQIRRLQRQMRRKQMLKEAETATVVVTNPTHFAVAMRYQMDMDAPIVVAKGRDLVAAQIREVARWHSIPILENPPLAQALYRTASIGQAIPGKLYTAVAEILAFVYRTQAQARNAAARGAGGNRMGEANA